MSDKDNCQLYIISPPIIKDLNQFVDDFAAHAESTKVACIQIRLKNQNDDFITQTIEQLKPVCKETDTALIINDRPDICLSENCDGVHLGENDMAYTDARNLLGEDFIIGVTCGASVHKAMHLSEAGADYVAFGSVYPTKTKQVAASAPLELISNWSTVTNIPTVAIGGITVANCKPVIESGANFLAICSGIWDHSQGPKKAINTFIHHLSE